MLNPDRADSILTGGPFITPAQSRAVDRLAADQYGIPGIVLMENAGRGCVEQLQQAGCRGPVVILCGPGNNGGDGLVIGRHLAVAGMAVKCVILGDPSAYRGDARVNFEIASRLALPIELAGPSLGQSGLKQLIAFVDDRPAEWIVDAILGTGAKGAPRSPAAEIIQMANQLAVRRMAIDLPSGLDGETGELHVPTFRADITCTFVAAKTGFQRAEAADWLGNVKVVGIGITPHILKQVLDRP